jgi:FkbM family methyltransferase
MNVAIESPKVVDYLQIGAHIGNTFNDHIFATNLSGKTLILVEPVNYLYKQLMENYAKYHPAATVFFINAAVSNKDHNTIDLYVPSPENDFQLMPEWANQIASLRSHHVQMHGLSSMKIEKHTVPCITLNQIISQFNIVKIDTLVIDTEGHDYEILMDLDLTKVKPVHIIFENKHMDDTLVRGARYAHLLHHFKENGYVVQYENSEDTCLTIT